MNPSSKSLNARGQERTAFLEEAGWAAAKTTPLAGDASTRSYERLHLGERRAILMNAPTAAESKPCPIDATPEIRNRLGYNALARLAGPNLNAFIAIARTLRSAGLSAPDIYFADVETGFALIEDLGDSLYASAIKDGADEPALYASAIDALVYLKNSRPPPPHDAAFTMLSYDRTAMEAEVLLILDWYWPFRKNVNAERDVYREYLEKWSPILESLSRPSTIVLRDYHAENLLWLPEREGYAQTGIIDFQDGLIGHAAYDLVSLLEDARRDVSPELAAMMIRRYEDAHVQQDAFDRDEFRREYAILGAQRNAKILGIFARLAKRDGKMRYASLLPRVEAHFRNDLRHHDLAPVAEFFRRHFPEAFP